MQVTNLTDKVQDFKVRELTGEHREYAISLQPHGSTDVGYTYIVNPSDYEGILSTNEIVPVISRAVTLEEEIVEISQEELLEPAEEIVTEPQEESKESSDHICPICGAEFGSDRGLKTHMNKAHNE